MGSQDMLTDMYAICLAGIFLSPKARSESEPLPMSPWDGGSQCVGSWKKQKVYCGWFFASCLLDNGRHFCCSFDDSRHTGRKGQFDVFFDGMGILAAVFQTDGFLSRWLSRRLLSRRQWF